MTSGDAYTFRNQEQNQVSLDPRTEIKVGVIRAKKSRFRP